MKLLKSLARNLLVGVLVTGLVIATGHLLSYLLG
jgi:hypothetical protein